MNLQLPNETGQPVTTRVFYQPKPSMESGLFLADVISSGVIAVAEGKSVATLLVAPNGRLTHIVSVLQNLPSGSLLAGLQLETLTTIYTAYLFPASQSVALVLTNTRNSTSTILRLMTP